MKTEQEVEKMLHILQKCEKYFYWYLLKHDKIYIERFFLHTKKLKRIVQKWKTQ